MALKTLNYENKVKVKRIFTDRVEPRKIFWNNYNYLKDNIHNGESKVISYYGIGGVGKTSLCKKIIDEIDTKYVYYDFNISQDYKEILTHIKEDLKSRYGFSFPLFEYGLYCYAIKSGHNPSKKETQGIIQSSSFLSYVFKIADTIPFVSNVSNVLKNIDEGATIIKSFFDQYNNQLKEIEVSDITSIETLLPKFFADDLNNNLKNETTPFVIILDTYEKLVNELSSLENSLYNDLWLRNTKTDCEGIIIRVPKLLWIISGREKLKWQDFSNIWDKNALEQYNLGNLSETDSIYFLKNANITDLALCKKIYKLTNGVPIHLDLCVEQYETMLNNNKVPSIDDFGHNIEELANNFFKYLDDEMNDILYILTCIEKWTDNLFYRVSSFFNFAISPTKYEKIKNLSFVLTKDNINFMFHQKIQEVLFFKCPKQIKLEYINFINRDIDCLSVEPSPKISFSQKRQLQSSTILFKTSKKTFNKSKQAKYSDIKKESNSTIFNKNLQENNLQLDSIDCELSSLPDEEAKPIKNIAKVYQSSHVYKREVSISEISHEYEKKLNLELSLDLDICELYYKYKDLLIKCIDTYNFYTFDKLFGKLWLKVSRNVKTKEYVLYEGLYMLYLAKKGNLNKASILMKVIEVVYLDVALTTDEILFFKKCMSTLHNYLGNYEVSLQLNKELYHKYAKLYGKNNHETLTMLHYLGTSYSHVGKEKKALQLRTSLYNRRQKIFGDTDINTLRCFYRIGLSHINLGNYDKGLEIMKKDLENNTIVYGAEHPNTLKDLHNIGKIYYLTGNYDKALELLTDVYNKRSIYIGQNHPDSLRTQYYIGLIHKETKDYKTAISILTTVYEQRIKYIGKTHPDTIKSLNTLNNIKQSSLI